MHQQQTAFENFVGKGEIARYEQFLLFPPCFLHNLIFVSPFFCIFDIVSLFAAEMEELKIGISVKGLSSQIGHRTTLRENGQCWSLAMPSQCFELKQEHAY